VTRWRPLRPTRVESALGAVLLCLSIVEMLFSDEQPPPDAIRVISAVVPPLLVAFSRNHPRTAAGILVVVFALASVQPSESGTLGAGFAWLALLFALGAWSRQPWPWVAAVLLAGVVRDLRTVNWDLTDLLIDVAFLGFALAAGRVVHRRARQADALSARLRFADADRESRTEQAVAHERAVIARELHDIVAHSVSLMVVQAGTARPVAERVDQELAAVLENIEHSGREALTELRRLLGVLRADHEPDLQPVPDLGRLDDLVASVRRAGLEIDATLDLPDRVPAGVALCAYRSVQEGLTNAMRYAEGSSVEVTVTGDRRTLLVRVQDHRDAAASGNPSGHLGTGTGLVGLRERVLLCGGQMAAGPTETGYLLAVTLPMADETLVTNPTMIRP
jgi:signal transduction histidine kinase